MTDRADVDGQHLATSHGEAATGVFAASIGVAFLRLVPAALMWLGVLPAARVLVSRGPEQAAARS